MTDQKHTPEPLYSCWHDECRENITYPADMLKSGPDGMVCENCWEDGDFSAHQDEDDNFMQWVDLPKFTPREAICVNAMQGIDDPAAFMRAVRELADTQHLEALLDAADAIIEHLKGGA